MDFHLDAALSRALSTLGGWWEMFWEMLPNILVALVLFVGFWLLGQALRSGLKKLLQRTSLNATTIPILSKIGSFAATILGMIVALKVLHLEEAAASLLAGAGILGLAAGFAFQDVAANYFAGFVISIKRPFEVGDYLETNDVSGVVQEVQMRTTKLRTTDGKMLILPNRKVFQEVMINYSTTGERRVEVEVGVSYAEDLEHVERVTLAALEELDMRLEGRQVEVYFDGFGGSSIDLSARMWIPYRGQADYHGAKHKMLKAIKSAYDREGITIPFPIRTLDFGIGEAGASLATVWPKREGGARSEMTESGESERSDSERAA